MLNRSTQTRIHQRDTSVSFKIAQDCQKSWILECKHSKILLTFDTSNYIILTCYIFCNNTTQLNRQPREAREGVTVKAKETRTRKWYRQNPRQTACKQYVFSIEADVYDDFKRHAFRKGHSINSMVGELIKRELSNDSNTPVPRSEPNTVPTRK